MGPESAAAYDDRPLDAVRPVADVSRWLAALATALLALVAAAFSWRRLLGALTTPLTWAALSATGIAVACVAMVARRLWRQPFGDTPFHLLVLDAIHSASVLAIGLALSIPGTHPGGLIPFWIVLIAGESWAWRSRAAKAARHARDWAQSQRTPGRTAVESTGETDSTGLSASDRAAAVATGLECPGGDVLQRITRARSADGVETITGWLRVPIVSGQRFAAAHVAFCPPFERPPELTFAQHDGPPARIRAAQVLSYGARLELRLPEPAEDSAEILLEFSARG